MDHHHLRSRLPDRTAYSHYGVSPDPDAANSALPLHGGYGSRTAEGCRAALSAWNEQGTDGVLELLQSAVRSDQGRCGNDVSGIPEEAQTVDVDGSNVFAEIGRPSMKNVAFAIIF